MNDPRQRAIERWLDGGPERGPDDGLARALEVAFKTPQRPGWATSERWYLDMQLSITRPLVAAPRTFLFLVVAALLVAALLAVVVGSSRRHLPPPIGPAANGLLAEDSGMQIGLAAADGSGLRIVTPASEADALPVFSPDGQHVAFFSWPVAPGATAGTQAALGDGPANPIGSVVVMDSDGGHRTVLARDLILAAPNMFPLTWSHDSSRVAFAHLDGSTPTISVVRIDGTAVASIPGGDSATWSPDDKLLAFRLADAGVYVISSDGSGAQRVVSSSSGSGFAFALPQWSPDGTRLAFYAGEDGDHDVKIAQVDGTHEASVDATRADEYWPTWSPDGSKVAFMRVVNNDNEINFVVANADGSNASLARTRPLSGTVGGGWSPDGQLLVGYVPGADANTDVVLIDAATGKIRATIPSQANIVSWQRVAP